MAGQLSSLATTAGIADKGYDFYAMTTGHGMPRFAFNRPSSNFFARLAGIIPSGSGPRYGQFLQGNSGDNFVKLFQRRALAISLPVERVSHEIAANSLIDIMVEQSVLKRVTK